MNRDELPPRTPMTAQQIQAAEYAKMNDDEKRAFNLRRSQRSEPTGTIAPLGNYVPFMRNGIASAPPPPSPSPGGVGGKQPQQQQQQQQQEPLQRYDTPVADDGGNGGGSGMIVGVVVGLGVAVAAYFGGMRLLKWASGNSSPGATAYSAQSQMVAMVPH